MLKAEYDSCMNQFKAVLGFDWHDSNFYKAWLAQTYFYSRQVTRILLMASAHVPLENVKLHKRFASHSGEETGHELLALRDLKDFNTAPEAIGEFPLTRGFYCTQYYTIQHVSPQALFGWILPLEGLANDHGKDMLRLAQKNPQCPSRFLDVHVDEDPDHVERAFDAVKNFSKEHQEQIVYNMRFTVESYLQILENCQAYAIKCKVNQAA